MNKFEKIEFRKLNEIPENEFNQIKKIWKVSFNQENLNDLIHPEYTIIVTIKTEKIVAIAFILFPTSELLKSSDMYLNIQKQGVTDNDSYIYNFCVKKTNRRTGYGKLLLENCHQYISKIKNKVILFVENENIPAICLYNKFGYSVHIATPSGFIMKKKL